MSIKTRDYKIKKNMLLLIAFILNITQTFGGCGSSSMLTLRDAINLGNLKKIEKLLKAGVNSDEAFFNLTESVRVYNLDKNLIESIGNLLKKYNVNINYKTEGGFTALGYAQNLIYKNSYIKNCFKTNFEIVKLLIKLGADVNLHSYGRSGIAIPLNHEIHNYLEDKENHLLIIKDLINAGADLNLVDNNGTTLLMRAVQTGCNKIVSLLLENGANINLVNKDGATALIWAAFIKAPEIIYLLVISGADTTIVNNQDQTFFDIIKDKPECLEAYERAIEYRRKICKEIYDTISQANGFNADMPAELVDMIADYCIDSKKD